MTAELAESVASSMTSLAHAVRLAAQDAMSPARDTLLQTGYFIRDKFGYLTSELTIREDADA